MPKLQLVSHDLCPYVQRAAIALTEKGVAFERSYVDLAAKPDWFLRISPLGKVPLLKVGDEVIFKSAVILEYLEETQPRPLYPADPLTRARQRASIDRVQPFCPISLRAATGARCRRYGCIRTSRSRARCRRP